MQAQSGFLEGGGTLQALGKVWRAEGIRGLYRGWIPPMWGSGLYRSTQFAVYEALFTKWDRNRAYPATANGALAAARSTAPSSTAHQRPNLNPVIPLTFGLEFRVLQAAWCASLARAVIECPIEFAKVARQTNQNWALRHVYTGFGVQWVRTWGVMTTYFVLIDSIRRHHPAAFSHPFGQFLASSCSATLGFILVWPFEVLKNQVQANTHIWDTKELKKRGITSKQLMNFGATPVAAAGAGAATAVAASTTASSVVTGGSILSVGPSILPAPLSSPSLFDRVRYLYFTHGISGLYRGIGPGTARSMISNGVSMVVMLHAQKKITQWGWRD